MTSNKKIKSQDTFSGQISNSKMEKAFQRLYQAAEDLVRKHPVLRRSKKPELQKNAIVAIVSFTIGLAKGAGIHPKTLRKTIELAMSMRSPSRK